LPVNVTGLVLIALALMLFIFDVYATTHGILTVGGIVAFLIGSLMLFNRGDPLFRFIVKTHYSGGHWSPRRSLFSSSAKGCARNSCRLKVGAQTLIEKR
jgi:membrane-bound ClpP family serine protease